MDKRHFVPGWTLYSIRVDPYRSDNDACVTVYTSDKHARGKYSCFFERCGSLTHVKNYITWMQVAAAADEYVRRHGDVDW